MLSASALLTLILLSHAEKQRRRGFNLVKLYISVGKTLLCLSAPLRENYCASLCK